MKIKSKEFVKSSAKFTECPQSDLPEYAMIGRSNVGKSSFINMLIHSKGLAKTSAKPGKTRLINHFLINESWFLVDLPGYGYAQVSKKDRAEWQGMIKGYLGKRQNLFCVMFLVDSRHEPQKKDLEFADLLGELQVPFVIVFTKADKQGKLKTAKNVKAFLNEMRKKWADLPDHFVTSAQTKDGRLELLDFIRKLNEAD